MVDPIAFKQSEKNTVRIEPKNHHHRWLKSSVVNSTEHINLESSSNEIAIDQHAIYNSIIRNQYLKR
jgi:hypothetical protein